METEPTVPSEQAANKFYLPGSAKQSSAPGRIERALRSLLPDMPVQSTPSASIPDIGFYLPGVKLADRIE